MFADSSFVEDGCVIPIGGLLIYMATIVSNEYPGEVLSDGCSSVGSICDELSDHAEVFTASEIPNRRPAVERGAGACDGAGGSNMPVPNRLTEALEGLRTPVTPGENVATQAANLDVVRLHVLEDAEKVAAVKRQLEATVREFNSSRGLPADGRRTQVHQ